MGFWVFMLVSDMLIPAIMLGFGTYFEKRAPKEINDLFGYRTTMSMKNRETWEFAHHICGKLWKRLGWILLLLSILGMLAEWFWLGSGESAVGACGTGICMAQCVVLVASIFPVEAALKRHFDEDGNPRGKLSAQNRKE